MAQPTLIHSAKKEQASFLSQRSGTSTAALSGAVSDSTSDCSLTPRGDGEGGTAMPGAAALRGACGLPLQVKNTFLHVSIPDGDARPAMRRSVSGPALLTRAEIRETAKSEVTAESEDTSETEMREQDVKVWASQEEMEAARREMIYLHRQGVCRPCLYFAFKADSCRYGDDCQFCHLCTREDVTRRRKQRKMQTRGIMTDATRKEAGALYWARRRDSRFVSRGPTQAAAPGATRPCAPGYNIAGAAGTGPPAASPFHGQPRASKNGHQAVRPGRAAPPAKFVAPGPVRT